MENNLRTGLKLRILELCFKAQLFYFYITLRSDVLRPNALAKNISSFSKVLLEKLDKVKVASLTFLMLLFLVSCNMGKREDSARKDKVTNAEKKVKQSSTAKIKPFVQPKDTILPADNIDRQILELRKELKDAEIVREGNEIKIVFNSQILFDVNSDHLKPSSEKALTDLSNVLKKYSGTIIEVKGHTDNTGPEDFNMVLSKKRAAAVARYAAGKGVKPTRFKIIGFGETMPIASNKTEEGKSLNRRVEISIKGKDLISFNEGSKVSAPKQDSSCYCTYDEYHNYVCKRLCDSWIKLPVSAMSFNTDFFKKPAGLDELIASVEKPNGGKVYLLGGDNFIARQNLGNKLDENNAIMMVGKVFDKSNHEPSGARIKIKDLNTGKEVATLKSDSISGGFSVLLERGKHYSISVEEKGYFLSQENIRIPEKQGFTVIHQDLEMNAIREGQKMNLNNVFFLQSKAILLESSYGQLDEVVKLMLNNPTIEIELHGHTDGIGDPDLNYTLSEDRVRVIKNYLMERGVPAKRISTKAFGGMRPIASNDAEETRKLNRRVEFLIVKF